MSFGVRNVYNIYSFIQMRIIRKSEVRLSSEHRVYVEFHYMGFGNTWLAV